MTESFGTFKIKSKKYLIYDPYSSVNDEKVTIDNLKTGLWSLSRYGCGFYIITNMDYSRTKNKSKNHINKVKFNANKSGYLAFAPVDCYVADVVDRLDIRQNFNFDDGTVALGCQVIEFKKDCHACDIYKNENEGEIVQITLKFCTSKQNDHP